VGLEPLVDLLIEEGEALFIELAVEGLDVNCAGAGEAGLAFPRLLALAETGLSLGEGLDLGAGR
jgi:hypothetical protein